MFKMTKKFIFDTKSFISLQADSLFISLFLFTGFTQYVVSIFINQIKLKHKIIFQSESDIRHISDT